ncbi:MAG: peptidylprolyl isomerase [Elusimicrobia bacterium]|nr:peptidylprolyl isomerase [Elusimicrobiota bacterium]
MSNSSRILAAVAALFLAGRARAALVEDTVAVVNGEPIMKTEYQKNLDTVMDQYKHTAPQLLADPKALTEVRSKVLDQMIDDKLFEQEALRLKVKIHDREVDAGINEVRERNFRRDPEGRTLTDEEIEKSLASELKKEGISPSQFRERIRKQMMIRRVIEEIVKPKVKAPEPAEIRKAFEKVKYIIKGDSSVVQGLSDRDAQAMMNLADRVKLVTSERIHAFHILVKVVPNASMVEKSKALVKAQEIKKQLDAPDADFSEIAKKSSDDKESGERGGDLGPIVKGTTGMPDFEKAAFALPLGEVSEPVESNLGYHLIRVTEKKAAESLGYEKLKDDIGQFLLNMGFEKELEKTAQELRKRAQIERKLPKEG